MDCRGNKKLAFHKTTIVGAAFALLAAACNPLVRVGERSSASPFYLPGITGTHPASGSSVSPSKDAIQLVFTVAPALTSDTDTALAIQPLITAKDVSNNSSITYAGTISFLGYSDTSCGTLVPVSINPGIQTNVSGVVSFTGVKILKTNVVAIKATDGTLNSSCLSGFTISPGALNALTFNTQASVTANTGTSFVAQPAILATDANNNALGAGTAITLSLTSGTPTLACTTNPVSTNASGLASFAGCTLTGASGTYTLTGTSGGKTIASNNIVLGAGVATQLIFTTTPTLTGNTDTALTTQPVVTAKDASNNQATSYAGTITFTGYSDSGCTTSVPTSLNSGTPTNTSGVVSFSGVKVLKTNVIAIKATDGTLNSSCLNGFTISPGAINALTYNTQPSATATSGTNFTTQPIVLATDANNNALGAGTAITLSLTSGTPTLACTTNPVSTNASGLATFAGCTLTGTAGTYTLTGTSGGKTIASNNIVLGAGAATQLIFTTTPTLTGNTDTALTTQPVVTAKDASNNQATSYAGTITFTGYSDSGCTTSVPTSLNSGTPTNTTGVVSFTGVKILKTNVIAIKATDGTLSSSCLNGFTISPGAINALTYNTQPSATATSGTSFVTQPVVLATDANNNALGAGTSIVITLTSGAPTLACTATTVATNASGLATFAGCALTGTAGTYTLTGTSGVKTIASNNIVLGAGVATQLIFTTTPTLTGNTDTALTTQPVVTAKDASNNQATSYAGTITFTGYSDSGCTTSVPTSLNSGTPTNTSGVVSFTGVKVLKTNVIAIKATDGTLNSSCLNGFTISPGAINALTFNTQPSATATSGTGFGVQPVILATDANNNALGAGTAITLSLTSGTPTLACTTNPVSTNASGLASFAGCTLTGASGTYTLTGTSGGKTIASNNIVLGAGAANQLIFTTTPTLTGNTDTALTTQPVVTAKDASNNQATSYAGTITFTGYSDSGCTTSVPTSLNSGTLTNTSGVVSFSGVKVLKTNVIAIKATDGTLSSSCLSGFTISPGALNALTYNTQPSGTATSGTSFVAQPVVLATDANNNALGAGTAITLSLTSGTPTLACTTNPVSTNASGLATFAGCTLTGASGTYTLTGTSGAKTIASNNIVLGAGAATQLIFTTTPTLTGNTDTALTTQPVVTAKDASNNQATSYAGTITFTGYSDSGCTTSVPTSLNSGTPTNTTGVVSFSGVKVLKTNVIAIKATDGTLSSSCLNGFTISPGVINALTLNTQPSATATSGTNFTTQPIVLATDANNNALGAGTAITLSLTSGTPILACTTNPVSTNASGLATFAGCALTGTAGTYTLTGTSGGKTIASNNIVLGAGVATQLIFTTPPTLTGNTDTALTTQPVVTAKDASNNQATSYAGTITFTGYSDSGCTTSVPTSLNSGTPTNTTGVVSFSGVKVLKTNVIAIKATDGTLNSSCLNGFTISPGAINALTYNTQPSATAMSGTSFVAQPVVLATDANNNALGAGTAITLSLTSGTPTLACTTNPVSTNASGLATFAGCALTGTAGTYTLTGTSGVKTIASNNIVLGAGVATQLIFTTTPTLTGNTDTALTTQPVVTAKDASNNQATSYAGTITFTGYSDSGCTTSVPTSLNSGTLTNTSGVVSFSGVKVLKTNVIAIKATDGTLNSSCLNGFTISPGAINALTYNTQPSATATSGTGFGVQPVVLATDANNNALGAGTSIVITLTSGAPTLACTATTVATNASGLATFAGCALTGTAGTYTLTGTSGGKTVASNNIVLTAVPVLSFSPLTNAFGTITIGNYSSYVSFTLSNTGAGAATTCTAPTLSNASDFTIFSDGCGTSDLAALSSCVVNIRANPGTVGAKTSTLSRSCAVGGSVSTTTNGLTTTGSGTITVAWNQSSYAFGNVRATSQSSTTTLYFQNLSLLTASSCTTTANSNTTDFTIVSDGCGTSNLNPFDQCSIQVKANPTTTGAKSATISRTCSGTTATVALTSTGLAPGLSITSLVSSPGASHNCAIMSDGSVRCWGYNAFGQLGDGTTTQRTTPTSVTGLSGTVIALAINFYHTCAVITGGTVQCWGYNGQGQLGDGTLTQRNTPTSVTGLSGTVTAIAAGYGHTCALITGGTIQCWGSNGNGQLGDGTTTQRTTPTSVTGLSGTVTAIAAGNSHTCALITGGTVQCWGYNGYGQLGDGTTVTRNTPTSVSGLSGTVTAIAAGDSHTCALITGGTVQCWGYNGYGQLGDGTTVTRNTPTSVSGLSGTVTAIAAGQYHTCALITGGTVQCWGYNGFGQLGDGTTTNRNTPTSVSGLSGTVTAIAAGLYHTCALITGGTLQCWGYNGYGQLGDGTYIQKTTPTSVSGLSGTVTAIAAGTYHNCALISGGTVQCWGWNNNGQLGDGTTTNRSTPTSVTGLSGTVTVIAAGYSHTCAVITGGTVQCWGYNAQGQLGDGTTTNRSTPTSVTGLSGTVTVIAAGYTHTCAVITGGTVQCWGNNAQGQLGDGTTTNRSTPTSVTGLSGTVTAIAAGQYHTCALISGGTLQCWGYNGNGQLGDGTTTNRNTPTSVTGLSGTVTAIPAGAYHTCALITGGTVQCWGYNGNGQLGDGTTTNRNTPTSVSGLSGTVTAIAAGNSHTCALITGGTVQCWGNNAQGQLGDGTLTTRFTPKTIPGQFSLSAVYSGNQASFTCILKSGVPYCFGDNTYYQVFNSIGKSTVSGF